jgi:broad specificity phosphatase PhoE
MMNDELLSFIVHHSAFIIPSMGQLILIRHGQAHAFADDSDRLTELGEAQARRLGEYWLRHRTTFTEIYSGTLIRQRRTAEIAAAIVAPHYDLPALQTLPGLNEYDAAGILGTLAARLLERDAVFQKLQQDFTAHRQDADRNRYFQRMFEYVGLVWLRGALLADGVESFAAFRERVRGALKQILTQDGSGRRVAVFTSGGVIGLAVQSALAAPDEQMLALNWRVRNGSQTEFTFSRARLSLDSFNSIHHLDDPALWSYR